MDFWNYRLFRIRGEEGNDAFQIRKVYYNKDGRITCYTDEALSLRGDTPCDILDILESVKLCLSKPVLTEGEISMAEPEIIKWWS